MNDFCSRVKKINIHWLKYQGNPYITLYETSRIFSNSHLSQSINLTLLFVTYYACIFDPQPPMNVILLFSAPRPIYLQIS